MKGFFVFNDKLSHNSKYATIIAMFTKAQASSIKSLHDKKYRQKTGLFLVEGEKNILETINSDYEIKTLLVTKSFYTKYQKIITNKKIQFEIVESGEIEKVSALESNDSALAIVKQKEDSILNYNNDQIIIALDNIRDPGNFGTIIRIADWYGIKKIIASIGTVDLYNPKVISATKGSFTRVQVYYTNLTDYLETSSMPILGAFLDGQNAHKFCFPKKGILLLGNESKGICEELKSLITKKITIPSFGQTESLNVAIATAILIDNWKRNIS